MENNTTTQRQDIARKIAINTILSAPFVRESETNNSYIQIGPQQIERVNVIGIVVNKEQDVVNSLYIDDSTGTVRVAVFNDTMFSKATLNQSVIVIGKIRQFGGTNYISAEIVRDVDKRWQEVRQKELNIQAVTPEEQTIPNTTSTTQETDNSINHFCNSKSSENNNAKRNTRRTNHTKCNFNNSRAII